MHATIRSYGPSELVDALKRNEGAVRGLLEEVDGFHAYYVVDVADGSAVSITLCDDQAGTDASTAAAAGWIRENLGATSIPAPVITAGDVALSFTA
jgi:hypothetical protein